jgi:spore germination cell wall hydrolase CwlJ-like protein
MFGISRACRLAAAVVVSLSMIPAAQAGPTSAQLTQAGTPTGATLTLGSHTAERVAGSFEAPAATAAPTVSPAVVTLQPAPANVAALPLSLAELVTRFAPTATLDDEAFVCLANAVYFEARGESLEGQLAVAEVVLNRVASQAYPDEVCAVVTQKAQFSFIRRGQFPRADETSEAWRRAVAIAFVARNGLVRSVPENVLWYHANYVSPSWGKRLTQVTRIGAHIFYS